MRKIFVIVMIVFLYGCISNTLASRQLKNGTGLPVNFNFDCDACEGSCSDSSCEGVTFGTYVNAVSGVDSDGNHKIIATVTTRNQSVGVIKVDTKSNECEFDLDEEGVYNSNKYDGTCSVYDFDDSGNPKYIFSQVPLCGHDKE